MTRTTPPIRPAGMVLLLFCLALSACGDDDSTSDNNASNSSTSNGTATSTTGSTGNTTTSNATTSNATTATSNGTTVALPEGCDVLVEPSDNDQDALQLAFIDAVAGQTLCLGSGTFSFNQQLTLGADNVTIRGAGPEATILDFSAQDVGANGIAVTGDGVTLEDFQVTNTPGDGIRATDVEGITFRRIHVIWPAESSVENGAYGLYPVGCTQVLIEECLAQGARDAGIYVGQSNQIIVRNNEARGNVAGIEIENSLDADVYDNYAHDNTAGILVFDLPGLDQFGGRAKVHNNRIESNNRPNFAEEGNIVAVVPEGVGVLVLASDDNEFHDNTITSNNSAGIVIVSWTQILTMRMADDPNYDLFPQGNYIHDNTFTSNGTDPATLVGVIGGDPPIPDILWDGCVDETLAEPAGSENCIDNNGEATYLNFALCGGDSSSDVVAATCQHPSLPTIDW